METIKEEKKADLEQLLNSLIEKGWKPFGDKDVIRVKYGYSVHFLCRPIVNFVLDGYAEATVPLKEILTSRSSGLWQFVCEKGYEIALEGEKPYIERDYIFDSEYYDISDYQYWLMVGALLSEDKLEDFLLSNIKVDE